MGHCNTAFRLLCKHTGRVSNLSVCDLYVYGWDMGGGGRSCQERFPGRNGILAESLLVPSYFYSR